MRKIKIIHVITRLCPGGAREVVLKIIENLDKERFDVTLICGPEDFSREDNEISSIRIMVIPQLIRAINPIKDLIALLKLYFLIKKERFDIAHTHTSKAGILGRTAAKLGNVPIIFHMPHGSIFHPVYYGKIPIFIFSRIEKMAALYTDKIIVGSDNEREDFINNGIGDEDKYIRIPYYFIRDRFNDIRVDRKAKRKELNIPEDALVLANIARLVPEKGHLFCLDALKQAVGEVSNIMLLIVGEGRLKEDIERKIIKLNLQGNVILTGFREDVPEILSAADISLHTSLWEGTPLTITEAMSLGKAVIATAVGGIPEMISDGINGILVQPQNTSELAGWIIRLSKDRVLLNNIGEKAQEYAKIKFNSKYAIKEITNLYDTFLRTKAGYDVR